MKVVAESFDVCAWRTERHYTWVYRRCYRIGRLSLYSPTRFKGCSVFQFLRWKTGSMTSVQSHMLEVRFHKPMFLWGSYNWDAMKTLNRNIPQIKRRSGLPVMSGLGATLKGKWQQSLRIRLSCISSQVYDGIVEGQLHSFSRVDPLSRYVAKTTHS